MAQLKAHFPRLTHYLEQQDIQSAFTEKQHTTYGGARPRGLWLQVLSVLHVAQSHADLSACVYALHAALLTASVQLPASSKSLLLSYLLLQSLPPFIEWQPKNALLPSQPPL